MRSCGQAFHFAKIQVYLQSSRKYFPSRMVLQETTSVFDCDSRLKSARFDEPAKTRKQEQQCCHLVQN